MLGRPLSAAAEHELHAIGSWGIGFTSQHFPGKMTSEASKRSRQTPTFKAS
jgi:hypothetical protein